MIDIILINDWNDRRKNDVINTDELLGKELISRDIAMLYSDFFFLNDNYFWTHKDQVWNSLNEKKS